MPFFDAAALADGWVGVCVIFFFACTPPIDCWFMSAPDGVINGFYGALK